MSSKKDGWELQLIDDKLQGDTSKRKVICKHPLGRNTSVPEKPVVNS